MSPERLEEGGFYGRPSDMWAVGLILYEMLTKTMPFDDLKQIMNHDPKPLPVWVSAEMKQLIYELLHKDPKQRKTCHEAIMQKLTDSESSKPVHQDFKKMQEGFSELKIKPA